MDVHILSLLVDERFCIPHIPCMALCYVQPFSLNIPVTCYYTGILKKSCGIIQISIFECHWKFWAHNTQAVIFYLKFWEADTFRHACIVEKVHYLHHLVVILLAVAYVAQQYI